MLLKRLTILFPKVPVFSVIKHSVSVSYIDDASNDFSSPSLRSKRKSPFKKLIPHSHDTKVLIHFDIQEWKSGKLLSFFFSLFSEINQFICTLAYLSVSLSVCQYASISPSIWRILFFTGYILFKNISSIINLFLSEGFLCKTAQFWLLYIDIMKMQFQAHTTVQENNYDLRLHTLQHSTIALLPLYYNFNTHSYAFYGAYFAKVLSHFISTLSIFD